MPQRARGILAITCAALLFSTGGLGIKVIDASPLAIAGYRSLFAIPVLAAWLLWLRRRRARAGGDVPSLGNARAWLAAASYAALLVFFVVATRLTTAANAILLQFTAPLYVALASRAVLGERVYVIDWVALVASLGGMLLCFGSDLTTQGALGNTFGIASGIAFAGFILLMRLERVSRDEDGSSPRGLWYVILGNAVAVVVTLPWMIAHGPATMAAWRMIVLLGTLQIGLPYVLFTIAVARLGAVELMLFAMLEPILNPIWVWLGIGEQPHVRALAGGAIIVAAVTVRGVVQAERARARVASP